MIRKEFWAGTYGRGYFMATRDNVTDEVLAKCIELQGAVPQHDDSLRVSEWYVTATIMPTLLGARTHRL